MRGPAPLSVELEIAGAPVRARADRALVWPGARTVFIADLHLGKAATFRSAGIPVPESGTREDLARLARIIREEGAERLVILGDLFHAKRGRTPAVAEAAAAWRAAHAALHIVLVRGNHDRSAGDPDAALGMEVVDNGSVMGPFALHHEPCAGSEHGYGLAGHIHPAVRLEDPLTGQTVRVPCFWFGAACAVVPAFGGFTGTGIVEPRTGDRVVALVGGGVVDISHRLV